MTQPRTFAKRLDTLHALIKGLKPRQYNHASFVESGTLSPPNTCGTVGCALGHAVVSGKFKNLKLRYNERLEDLVTAQGSSASGVSGEANDYFGPDAYETIFASWGYEPARASEVKRSQVLRRIRDFSLKTTGYVIG